MGNLLSWYFGPGGSEDKGPKDSIELLFKGNKYYSIAREAIQNSLDAVANKKKPVQVEFSLFQIKKAEMPWFFSIAKNIERCLDYYDKDPYAQKVFKNALEAIKGNSIKCLKISDYNTIGMEYEGEGEGPFYAFMQAVGVNLKSDQGSGGSFGFGKGAYYAASAIKSVLVSSVYGNNKFIFQGKARLTTHKEKGIKKDYVGIFGVNKGEPVTRRNDVPKKLVRTEKGTDIIIMGFHEEKEWKGSLIKSVLNNFWLSVADGRLIVKVEKDEINKNNLEEVISRYYKETDVDGSVNDPETWNPYPYYLAYKYKGSENTKFFSGKLPTLGNVKLHLLLREGMPNRTVFMRSPKMTVFKKTDNRGFNYAGVFVCDNEKGNRILKEMENPQHNEWRKTNYLDSENEKPHPDAVAADAELKAFVNGCLQQLMTVDTATAQKIIGLDKYLNIPEDLLQDEEGGGGQADKGLLTDEITKDENAEEATLKNSESKVSLAVSRKSVVLNKQEGTIGQGEEVIFTGAGGAESTGGSQGDGQPDGNPGHSPQLGYTESGRDKIKVPLPIKYRVIAQKQNANGYEHILKVFSTKDANADIEIHAGVDSDAETDGALPISNAVLGASDLNFKENKILSAPLKRGENLIKVKFDTNQKHSLKVSSYEI